MSPTPEDASCPAVEVEVTAHRIEEYAVAISDPNPRYRREGRDDSGMVAPRGFAAAYLQEPVRALAGDAERAREVGIDFTRVVFGEVEYRFHTMVKPGTWIRTTGRLAGRRTSGDKEIINFETQAHTDDGTLVGEATITLVRR